MHTRCSDLPVLRTNYGCMSPACRLAIMSVVSFQRRFIFHLIHFYSRQEFERYLKKKNMSRLLNVLRSWLVMVSVIALGNTVQSFRDHSFLSEKLYTGTPEFGEQHILICPTYL